MFQRSWTLLARAAHKQPGLIPAAMWARVQAATSLPPFMVWTTDENVKMAARRQLASAVLGNKSPPPPETAMPSAVPMGVQQGFPGAPTAGAPVFRGASRAVRARAIALDLPPSAFEVLGEGF